MPSFQQHWEIIVLSEVTSAFKQEISWCRSLIALPEASRAWKQGLSDSVNLKDGRERNVLVLGHAVCEFVRHNELLTDLKHTKPPRRLTGKCDTVWAIEVSYLILVDEEKHDGQNLQEKDEQEQNEELWRHRKKSRGRLSDRRYHRWHSEYGATVTLVSMKERKMRGKKKDLRHRREDELGEQRDQRGRKRNNLQWAAGTINLRDTLVPTDGSIHTHKQGHLPFPTISY